VSERIYRRLLRWAALPVTDRRWAAPLTAVALGFGLFVGVAIGPGASGTLAGTNPIIEIPALLGEDGEGTELATGGDRESEAPSEAETTPESSEGDPFASEPGFETPPVEEEDPPAAPEESEEEEAEALTFRGVVVHVNPTARSYTVAEASGALGAVHAKVLPTLGAAVEIPVRALANGTFAEAGKRMRTGSGTAAKLEGIVTHVDADPSAPGYVLSRRGVSLLVRLPPDPAGVPPLPALGSLARVEVELGPLPTPAAEALPPDAYEPAAVPSVPAPPTCESEPLPKPKVPASTLWQTGAEFGEVPLTYGDFAGVVIAACPSEGKLLLSADDLREAGAEIAFTVPTRFTLAKLELGAPVLATATIGPTGELRLKGLAGDERAAGADDAGASQGDLSRAGSASP